MLSSFRARLVILYTVTTGLALVSFSLILYFAIKYQSYKNLELSLAKRASHVIEQIDFQSGKLILPPSITRGSIIELRYEALVDQHGESFYVNPALGERRIILKGVNTQAISTNPTVIDSALSDKTQVKLAIIRLKHVPGVAYFITASPTSEVKGNLRSLATTMVFGNILFIVLVSGIGYIFARRALKPVHEVTKLAKEISSGDLKKRVNLQGPNDELKEMADTFDGMIARLEQLFETQKTFFQDVSHELRTPLTIIRGKIDVALRAKNASTDDYRKALTDVLGESELATRLVNDLLKVARGERLLDELHKSNFPADRMLAEVGSRIAALGRNKGIKVDISIPDESIMVFGDEQSLGEALLAIGDNAIKHCKQGDTVELSIRAEIPYVIIRIVDTGEGIPQEALPHIFDRFYRVNTSNTTNVSGSGLGLAIAKQIIDAHSGHITVASSYGAGTEFEIKIEMF